MIFNKNKVSNILNTFNITETGVIIAEKLETLAKKNKKPKNENNNESCNNFNQSSLYNKDSSN